MKTILNIKLLSIMAFLLPMLLLSGCKDESVGVTDDDDVWIFQIAEDLTMSSAVNITLSDGALAKNIFWQVAGEATIGTTSHFEGIILSMTGITLNTGATLNGRILAQSAAIFDGNTVVEPAQ